MQYDDRILNPTIRTSHRLAVGCVVQPQLGQNFAGAKVEILNNEIAFGWLRNLLSQAEACGCYQERERHPEMRRPDFHG